MKLKLHASYKGYKSTVLNKGAKNKKSPPKPSLKSLLAPKQKNIEYKPKYKELIPAYLSKLDSKDLDYENQLNNYILLNSRLNQKSLNPAQLSEANELIDFSETSSLSADKNLDLLQNQALTEDIFMDKSLADIFELNYDLTLLNSSNLYEFSSELEKNTDEELLKQRLQLINREIKNFNHFQNVLQFFNKHQALKFKQTQKEFEFEAQIFKEQIAREGAYAEHEYLSNQTVINNATNYDFDSHLLMMIQTSNFGNIFVDFKYFESEKYFEIAFKANFAAEDLCIAAYSDLEISLEDLDTNIVEKEMNFWSKPIATNRKLIFQSEFNGVISENFFKAAYTLIDSIIENDRNTKHTKDNERII